ncbi:MAG TPA: pyridoxal 5'-phosphate synthase glutaminase subunit PdxT [Spirochaetota bacterium]|nr:pyridoxal 5'-phosphate synthase glutaminase subunit PdxT [Spirochaetota bacterium]
MKAGVLAMQGAFHKHKLVMESLGAETLEVRTNDELLSVDCLIIPGGESTVMGKLLVKNNLMKTLRARILDGMPVFGTCAGMILMSRVIEGMDQPSLEVMDITVERNAYGRQLESFETELEVSAIAGGPFPGIFIRAPKIVSTGNGVEVLAELDSVPVLVRQKNMLAASFHPELTGDRRIHEFFASMVK